MIESEKALERKLHKEVVNAGGFTIKLLSTFITGLPDRLVLYKGQAFFVEVKTTGKKPTTIQLAIHKKLESFGFPVHVIDSTDKINNFIYWITI